MRGDYLCSKNNACKWRQPKPWAVHAGRGEKARAGMASVVGLCRAGRGEKWGEREVEKKGREGGEPHFLVCCCGVVTWW
jgi:hypothetical protein